MRSLSAVFVFFIWMNSFSQMQLYIDSVLVQSGDTVEQFYYGVDLPIAMYTNVTVKNVSANSQNVFVKFNTISLASNCDFNACWGAHCNYASALQSNDSVLIQSNESYTGLQINYHPNDVPNQESLFRFIFVDANNTSDTAYLYCKYGVYTEDNSGIEEIGKDYSYKIINKKIISTNSFQITQIYNQLGQLIKNENLENGMYYIEAQYKLTSKKFLSKIYINEQ